MFANTVLLILTFSALTLTPLLEEDPDHVQPEEEDEDDEAHLRVVHAPGHVILGGLDGA